MRASTIEADIREEVMKEMEERMQAMEKMFMRRLASEVRFFNLYYSFKLSYV